MGNISVEKANQLFWLGRYTERVFTTLSEYFETFDQMLDDESEKYQEFCARVGIPDIYGTKEEFQRQYIGSTKNPDSVLSNLYRAYDNAVVLREEISSNTLAYIQMALNCIKNHRSGETMYFLQEVLDNLYAFWGSADDCVDDEECRNIMKCGKYLERLDLYIRLKKPYQMLEKEFCKLKNRLVRIRIPYDEEAYQQLITILNQKENWERDANIALNSLCRLLLI